MGGLPFFWARGSFWHASWLCCGCPTHVIVEGLPCALQSSVMEGAGRKLRGYDSIRLRNTIMQQTGFLETPSKEPLVR